MVGHTTKQMKHGHSRDIQIWWPSVENVALTNVHHLYNVKQKFTAGLMENASPGHTRTNRQVENIMPRVAHRISGGSIEICLFNVAGTLAIYMVKYFATHTHTHAHPFNGPFSGTTQVSRYQKGKTSLDFTEARDSEWQWHQLGHVQVCTSLQTDNHTSNNHNKNY